MLPVGRGGIRRDENPALVVAVEPWTPLEAPSKRRLSGVSALAYDRGGNGFRVHFLGERL